MKFKTVLFLFVIFFYSVISFSQTVISNTPTPYSLSFGRIAKEELTINELLSDSLRFIPSSPTQGLEMVGYSLADLRVTSFNLIFFCNGIVVSSFENIQGTKLTRETKVAIKKIHPGCRVVFEKIIIQHKGKGSFSGYTYIGDELF